MTIFTVELKYYNSPEDKDYVTWLYDVYYG